MKKQIVSFLTLMLTLSFAGLINTSAIEEKQPTFEEALEFFQKKAAETTEPARKKAQQVFEQAKEVVVEKVAEAADDVQKALNTELKSRVDVLEEQNRTLTTQLQQEQEKIVELRNQMSEAAQEDATADTVPSEQLSQATQETDQLQKQVAQLQEQVANLTQELDQSNQKVQEKDNMIAVLEAKVEQALSVATKPTAIPAAPPLATAVEEKEEGSASATQPASTSALQEHLAAIRAGVGLKPVDASDKKQPEQTGILGAIAAGLQSRFGWMFGQEEPEDEWDNEVEDFLQTQ